MPGTTNRWTILCCHINVMFSENICYVTATECMFMILSASQWPCPRAKCPRRSACIYLRYCLFTFLQDCFVEVISQVLWCHVVENIFSEIVTWLCIYLHSEEILQFITTSWLSQISIHTILIVTLHSRLTPDKYLCQSRA